MGAFLDCKIEQNFKQFEIKEEITQEKEQKNNKNKNELNVNNSLNNKKNLNLIKYNSNEQPNKNNVKANKRKLDKKNYNTDGNNINHINFFDDINEDEIIINTDEDQTEKKKKTKENKISNVSQNNNKKKVKNTIFINNSNVTISNRNNNNNVENKLKKPSNHEIKMKNEYNCFNSNEENIELDELINKVFNNINNNNFNNNQNNYYQSNNINKMNYNYQINNNYNNINIQNNNQINKLNNINNIKDNKKDNIDKYILNCFEEKFKQSFPESGLKNVGLTCYMNSTLQCLLHIPELNSYFINIYPIQKNMLYNINKDAETRGRLSEEYFKLVEKAHKNIGKENNNGYFFNDDSISPKDFNNVLSTLNPQFSKFESNDSKDLLLYLIQTMHSELNYYGDKKLKKVPKCNQLIQKESFNFFIKVNSDLNLSIFSYLFYGILISNTKCSGCKNTLYNYQYFQFLSFPAFNYNNKKFNVYQGLKEYIKPEIMKGDNQCYCQNCKGLRDAEVTSKLFYTPPYLIINIDYGKDKIYKPKKVEFGEIIDITYFTDDKNEIKQYELIAISTHIGRSGNSGHNIAYCKNINNNKWYKFNDSMVDECNFSEVNSNSPYLLLFKLRKIYN